MKRRYFISIICSQLSLAYLKIAEFLAAEASSKVIYVFPVYYSITLFQILKCTYMIVILVLLLQNGSSILLTRLMLLD